MWKSALWEILHSSFRYSQLLGAKLYKKSSSLSPASHYFMFVYLPKLGDQAVSINRSSRNYTPTLWIKYIFFHMLFLQIVCIWPSVIEPRSELPQLPGINRKKKNSTLSSHLHLKMRWGIIYLSSVYREGETGFKLISHQVKYSICHGSTEKLIIPHKEWMWIWYATRNTFSSNEYFMILAKRSVCLIRCAVYRA